MSALEEKVIKAAANGYCVDESEVALDTRLKDLSNVSIRLVAFLSNLEETIGVYINPRQAMGLQTVGDYVKYIEKSSDK